MSAARPAATLGRPRLHLKRTDSTNDRARELAAAGAPHGTLVTASEQTAGRGRHGRSWTAPPGRALLTSMLLRWAEREPPPRLLPLAAAVAVCDVAGENAQIKWPNDVVLAAGPPPAPLAKLAGILVEGRPQERWAVLGIGVNVAVELTLTDAGEQLPAELRPGGERPAATLGRGPDELEPTLAELLTALERRLAEATEATLAAWRARDALLGREIAWGAEGLRAEGPRTDDTRAEGSQAELGRGRAAGVDGEGRLIVDLPGGGRLALGAGEVHLGPLR